MDADWSLLSLTITEVAEEVLGRPPVTERKDWFDDECREQASKRRAAEKALHSLPNRTTAQKRAADEARENYRAINRECNRFFRRKRREHLNGMIEEIQTASERKDPRAMVKTNQLRGGKTQRTNLIKDGNGNLLVQPDQIAARLKECFAALLNDMGEQYQPPTSPLQTQEDDQPTLEEMRDAVKHLKHNKASGEDGIPAELLQIGIEAMEDLLHKLIVTDCNNYVEVCVC